MRPRPIPAGMTCGDCIWFPGCRISERLRRRGRERECIHPEQDFLDAVYADGTPRQLGPPKVWQGELEPRLNLSALSADQKKRIWPLLLEEAPEVAETLEQMRPLAKVFGGSVTVAEADLPDSVFKALNRPRRMPHDN